MNKALKVSKNILIQSKPEEVWDVLTDPEKIKVYLYGTETITNWAAGSPIIFQGEHEGQKYKDKGNVLESQPNELLKYNYWSSFSGLEDSLENYSIVTYEIEEMPEDNVLFSWTQEGFANEEGQEHLEKGLYELLQKIKKLAEGK